VVNMTKADCLIERRLKGLVQVRCQMLDAPDEMEMTLFLIQPPHFFCNYSFVLLGRLTFWVHKRKLRMRCGEIWGGRKTFDQNLGAVLKGQKEVKRSTVSLATVG
jgi:hypothetical protein